MKRAGFAGFALAVLVAAGPASSALQTGAEGGPSPPEALILERRQGLWEGDGSCLCTKGRGTLAITPVLEGRFTRLEYRLERRGSEPALRFAGDAYYAVANGRLSGTWFDSQGNVYALETRAQDGALVFEWGPVGNPKGRTTLKRIDAVQLDVIEEARGSDGVYRESARIRFQRR